MKKALLICGLAISIAGNTAMAQTDAKAKSVLESVTKKVNSLKTLKANFTLKITGGKGGSVNDTKKGSISLKGQKYHLNIVGQEVICDNKTIWTYSVDAKEVTISTFNPKEQSISPAKLLTNFYDKEYKYKYVGEKKENGKTCDVVELTPNDNSKQVSKIELMVDKASSMITGGTIWSKNGNKTQYIISNIVPNSNIPDTYFAWDAKAHTGVEVNDMR
jgi:outer membrane lipoprotein carrier protein